MVVITPHQRHKLGSLNPPLLLQVVLEGVHQVPFDRLLIAQARVEGLMAVSSDGHWPGYDVSLHRV